jgi:ABC-2 type transport system permease protein
MPNTVAVGQDSDATTSKRNSGILSLGRTLRKAAAFVRRDFFIETSYKFQFLFNFFQIFFIVISFHFLSRLIGSDFAGTHLKKYGGDYFAFALIGIAIANFLSVGLTSFTQNIRTAMTQGSFEAMMVSPTAPTVIILFSSLWQFLFESIRLAIYLLIGVFLFKVQLVHPNYPAAVVVLILTVFAFASLGLITASILVVLKRGDPINWVYVSLSSLLGGVLFPITMLPPWLKAISYVFPITYSLQSIRLALLKGASFHELLPNILALLIFSAIVFPISVIVCGRMIRKGKELGSLSSY